MTEPAPFELPGLQTQCTDAVEFFDIVLADMFARPVRLQFCIRWQEHPEAVAVIEALWQTWEVAQHNPADGMAVWLRDFAYPLLFDRLCQPEGTFSGCSWKNEKHFPDTHSLPRNRA